MPRVLHFMAHAKILDFSVLHVFSMQISLFFFEDVFVEKVFWDEILAKPFHVGVRRFTFMNNSLSLALTKL